jgi:hypothetical protein
VHVWCVAEGKFTGVGLPGANKAAIIFDDASGLSVVSAPQHMGQTCVVAMGGGTVGGTLSVEQMSSLVLLNG